MKKLFLVSLIILSSTLVSEAQGNRVAWNMTGSSLAAVQAYEYRVYANLVNPILMTGVVCAANDGQFVCEANLPAYNPGSYSLTLTASLSGRVSESPHSNSLPLNIPIATPANFRIVP